MKREWLQNEDFIIRKNSLFRYVFDLKVIYGIMSHIGGKSMGERHKRKEIFSFILVSNMDNRSRQFSISALGLRILVSLLLLFMAVIGVIVYLYI